MSRQEIWKHLSYLTKELFISLYGSEESFLHPPLISPLEDYLIEFDKFMDEDGTIFQLAFRLGFVIPLNQHPAAYFYWVMRQVINKYTLTSSYNPNLKEIINMDYQTYLGWVKEQGEQIYKYRGESGYFKHGDLRTTDAYHQRLLMFL